MKHLRSCLLFLAIASGVSQPGCIQTAQETVSYEAVAVSRGTTATVDGWTITLTRADVALGPFYFCAAASGSSTLCSSSIAELTSVHTVDAILASPTPIGTVRGFTGRIRSAAYDYGISWFETQSVPSTAHALEGGHSIHLEGEASKDNTRIAFVAEIDAVPQYRGQHAIVTAPAEADISSSDVRLEVTLDPAAWLKGVDFDALPSAGASKAKPFRIRPGTPEHDAVLLGLKNLAPPRLEWVSSNTH